MRFPKYSIGRTTASPRVLIRGDFAHWTRSTAMGGHETRYPVVTGTSLAIGVRPARRMSRVAHGTDGGRRCVGRWAGRAHGHSQDTSRRPVPRGAESTSLVLAMGGSTRASVAMLGLPDLPTVERTNPRHPSSVSPRYGAGLRAARCVGRRSPITGASSPLEAWPQPRVRRGDSCAGYLGASVERTGGQPPATTPVRSDLTLGVAKSP